MRDRSGTGTLVSSRVDMPIDLESMISGVEGTFSVPDKRMAGLFQVEARSFFEGDERRTLIIIKKIEKIDCGERTNEELDQLRREKSRAFKQLEAEKHFADSIIDNAETLIIGMDMDGNIIIFNRKAEQSTGLDRKEVLGKNYFALFDADIGAVRRQGLAARHGPRKGFGGEDRGLGRVGPGARPFGGTIPLFKAGTSWSC